MVAKKKKGSGLLVQPDFIDRLLEDMMNGFAGRLSIKTRLGRVSAKEMDRLIPVFNRYPLARVIVHPRTGMQMYAGSVDLDAFENCLERISHPVIYNGDIVSPAQFQALARRFPSVSGWMLGRGLIADPFLPEMIRWGSASIGQRKARFNKFHDALLHAYSDRFSGPAHVLDRMKGLWRYFAAGQPNGPQLLKQIRKATSLDRYRQLVAAVLED